MRRLLIEASTEFFRKMTDDEWDLFVSRGGVVEGEQLRKLWAMSGLHWRSMPKKLQLQINREAVEKKWPSNKRKSHMR
jgi:hypothetical protein